MKQVKFNDLTLQIHKIKDLIDENINSVIESNAFIKGDFVKKFEENFKTYSEVRHSIGVSNGTDALLIAMEALSKKESLSAAYKYVASINDSENRFKSNLLMLIKKHGKFLQI